MEHPWSAQMDKSLALLPKTLVLVPSDRVLLWMGMLLPSVVRRWRPEVELEFVHCETSAMACSADLKDCSELAKTYSDPGHADYRSSHAEDRDDQMFHMCMNDPVNSPGSAAAEAVEACLCCTACAGDWLDCMGIVHWEVTGTGLDIQPEDSACSEKCTTH